MRLQNLHPWNLGKDEALVLQRQLAQRIVKKGQPEKVNLIAAADISTVSQEGVGRGGVVVVDYPELNLVEVKIKEGMVDFPYIPGLLAFRELPLLLAAFAALEHTPDLVLVDGQGLAHPRRLGIACHLGLWLGVPTIGCAKSRLCGQHPALPQSEGSFVELRDGTEVIGAVLRSKTGSTPVYVSIGHRIDLEAALGWVSKTTASHRLPLPLRLAHQAAGGMIEETNSLPTKAAIIRRTKRCQSSLAV